MWSLRTRLIAPPFFFYLTSDCCWRIINNITLNLFLCSGPLYPNTAKSKDRETSHYTFFFCKFYFDNISCSKWEMVVHIIVSIELEVLKHVVVELIHSNIMTTSKRVWRFFFSYWLFTMNYWLNFFVDIWLMVHKFYPTLTLGYRKIWTNSPGGSALLFIKKKWIKLFVNFFSLFFFTVYCWPFFQP